MNYIDMKQWNRKEPFEFFSNLAFPFVNVCFDVDVTIFAAYCKREHISFYYGLMYMSTSILNDIDAFHYKIREDGIIYHDELIPSFTDLEKGSDVFKIVIAPMEDTIHKFSEQAKQLSHAQHTFLAESAFDKDSLIYYSCLPWVSFTSISNEMDLDKNDSVPRITWGKYRQVNDRLLLPYSIQVNHRLLDGVHIGNFSNALQQQLNQFIV